MTPTLTQTAMLDLPCADCQGQGRYGFHDGNKPCVELHCVACKGTGRIHPSVNVAAALSALFTAVDHLTRGANENYPDTLRDLLAHCAAE